MKTNIKFRILEFIIAGLLIDTIENIISIKLSTGSAITPEVFLIAFLVVIPFSILTEVIIDHPKFWERCGNLVRKFFKS